MLPKQYDVRPQTSTNIFIQDFWSVHNHIELSSRLVAGCDYSVFKAGIKPMWEDKANMNGGRWLINLDKKHRINCLDNFWLEVLLCLIGLLIPLLMRSPSMTPYILQASPSGRTGTSSTAPS